MDVQPTPEKPAESAQQPVVVKEKTKSRPAVVILSVLFLVSLAGAAVLGYVAYGQNQTVASANAEIARLFTENTALKNAQNSGASGAPTFDSRALVVSYDTLVEKRVTISEKDKADIEKSVKDALKVTDLPSGWAILVVSPDEKATNNYPRQAIVYIPAAGTTAAQLLEFNENENGKWLQGTYY